MGNWLETLMHKLGEQERQKQADAKIVEHQLAEEKAKKDTELTRLQEESSGQKERIRQQLLSILVKYEAPSMLADIKNTVWGDGRIIEESDIGPNRTSKVAIGLVYGYKKKYRNDYDSTNSQDSGTVVRKRASPWFETRLSIDGVIIRVEHNPSLRDKPKIYFKSGILIHAPDNTVVDYHRDEMRKQFVGNDRQHGPQSQLIVGQDDFEIISNLHLALATDSLRRQKYDGLPKRGLFSDKKSVSI